MNLVIDVGNTAVKMAVFQNDKLLKKEVFPADQFSKKFFQIKDSYPQIKEAIISSVSHENSEMLRMIRESFPLLEFDQNVSLPFENKYTTPNTLGKDRLALVAAAVKLYPAKNVLIIDSGTCITYDIKTSEEVYLGGAIAPGLTMRFKSLHKFTANLPLITPKPENPLIGNSTATSILSGIINGLEMELKGMLDAYRSEFEDLTIIFTGGDSEFLSLPLKNSIFANSNFLLEGLNFILEFNKTQ
ncbi:type III pantothenate kinase [Christiangramia fulva]|uniref:Type III pantothenate kinase n=1 Tax=Christiangramia fulva TaxID=2126553 RepID=A0A2R3Z257_9FLAO|nr:type III pantothenate kinase [Christiangramia fulva]AVR44328.1 type III pantothenate kinase [Christiangramia fulva]